MRVEIKRLVVDRIAPGVFDKPIEPARVRRHSPCAIP